MKDIIVRYPLLVSTIVFALLFLLMTGLYLRVETRGPVVSVPMDLSELSEEKQNKLRKEVLSSLSYIMVLPSDLKPVMATVKNANELKKQQAFYANAENGDVLLVFQESSQAVIYRPSERKIVNAGSLVVN